MDAIYGVTKQMLAEIFSKQGELRAQFGEPQSTAEFERWLADRGLDQNTYALAHNAWHDRFRADPTGRGEAEFHMMLQQLSQKAHFGDVRDMSQDTEEGITLDQYAQIVVAISRAGANADQVVKDFGLQDVAHWQRANAAWTKKMGEDTSHKLTMQYGQLYGKYAGPQFQEEMVAQTAAILADSNKPRVVVDEPKEELTPDLCLQKMQSPEQRVRWKYAYHYAHMADLNNVPDKQAAIRTVTPILMEMIERHDEHTTSDAESGARKLWDLGDRSSDFRGAVGRCLNRAKEKLTSLEAAFAPIQNQAVPERVFLQSKIQDYRSLVDTMTGYQNEDWNSGGAQAPMPSPSFAPPAGSPMFAPGGMANMAPVKTGGGFPKWILAPVIILGVGGIFFATKGRAMMAARTAEAAAASASAASSSATSPADTSGAAAASNAAGAGGAPAAASAPAAKAAAPKVKPKKPH